MSDITTRAHQLLTRITPGPWVSVPCQPTMNGIAAFQVKPEGRPGSITGLMHGDGNVEFIAAAPQLVADLTAIVERVEKLAETWVGSVSGSFGRQLRYALGGKP